MNDQLNIFHQNAPDFLDEIMGFDAFGGETIIDENNATRYYINEFWTSRQRQAHKIHEVSYRACFKPQLPGFFIPRLSNPGDIVYDPFMGRGTTPLQAALTDRVAYGNDINPLSKTLVEPRLNTPCLSAIAQRLQEIPWEKFQEFENEELLTFFHPQTLARIEGLRLWLLKRDQAGLIDSTDKWIRMVAINRLTGHSPGFFSVYTLPPNQAVSVESQKKINAKRNQSPPFRDVPSLILKKSKSLLADGGVCNKQSKLLTKPAMETHEIADETVTLTVTSPPFLDIVSYNDDNWLRCWFIGMESGSVKIDTHHCVEDWQDFVADTLKELVRLTKSGGHIAFEVGEVRNGRIKLEDHVIAAASGLPLEILGVMINQQDFTKTSNCWGVSNNTRGTNTNRIVIMRKQS